MKPTFYSPRATQSVENWEADPLSPQLFPFARAVISEADARHPADLVLRAKLKGAREISRWDARAVSRAVFTFYRWRGWLDASQPLAAQLKYALELAANFEARPQTFSDQHLIERTVPAWIQQEMEVTPRWARSLQREPKLWMRARRGQGRALAEALGECWLPDDPAFADAVAFEGKEDLFRSPEFQAGEFEVQDVASQAVGLLCDPQPGETWWDACAGEGGKTLHLSDLMQNKGLIWASDRAAWRLKHLKLRAGRARCFNYRPAAWEGGAKLPTKTKFDGVLVDAPCSGVGTWQRNPHARWTTTTNDVAELAQVQTTLLKNAATAVKPGGKLFYSVCTLTRAETDAVADAFSQASPEFEPLSLAAVTDVAGKKIPGANGRLTIWPHQLDGNGMFIAVWQRR
ncbi:MAG: RsmB/NOP family class I SAM-dependent RNA methyltransferase [Verrucomicrobia bacterium]|nr:RsmB/NOP family class I SAM-dependent RNA methyltransferase [Verrucomicrobiota bacterium]